MTAAVTISLVVLWIAVVALSVVVFALARQIGVLYERVAPAGALMLGRGSKIGEAAAAVAIDPVRGALATIGGASADGRSSLVFFLSPTCPVCKSLLPALRSLARAEASWLRVVLAGDGARAEHEAFVRDEKLDDFDYVLSTELGIAYQVAKLPYAVLIDAGGVLKAGGLVNTREHLESLFEASERGISSIQEFVARQREGERERAKAARA
jgi:methylamine dehydrogenase accessory protein MauD